MSRDKFTLPYRENYIPITDLFYRNVFRNKFMVITFVNKLPDFNGTAIGPLA